MLLPKAKEVQRMVLHYNLTKQTKKALIKVIEDNTGRKAKYLGVPSCAYEIGDYRLERDGTLYFNGETYGNLAIRNALSNAGFIAEDLPQNAPQIENSERNESMVAEEINEPQRANQPSCDRVSISVPRAGFTDNAIENLKNLVQSKELLFKKAFLTEQLPIEITEETIAFPWFSNRDADSLISYTKFVVAICDMAKNQKRIQAKERQVDNEKYAFRCFLLRLGFIGAEYKADRKLLLKNLEGSSAFKNGAKGGEE